MITPIILIRFNPILDHIFTEYVKSGHRMIPISWKNHKPWEKGSLMQNVRKCVLHWEKFESKILTAIQSETGLQFEKNQIVVHVTGMNPRNISDPVIIRGTQTPEHFLESLVHELLHEISHYHTRREQIRVNDILSEIFPENEARVISHVFVYAAMIQIYEVVFNINYKPTITSEANTIDPSYRKALDIVVKAGAKEILSKLKEAQKRTNPAT